MAYYAVYVPPKDSSERQENFRSYVHSQRQVAFNILKANTDARLKVFKTEEEAFNFAQFGLDLTVVNNSSSHIDDSNKQPKSPISAINPEKPAFRAPKVQELVEFRKAIECGNLAFVHSKVSENPRFLVGSGDTPAILKESFRYNAMHVAALSKQGKMCDLILTQISQPSFVQTLHGRGNKKASEEVTSILLDLFLNMPEKGRNETPLHLAVKNGAAEVVEVLTSYPQCKMLPNNEKKLPKDIICFRMPAATNELKERIRSLLEERFFVPVIRSVDNSLPPTIGEPFSIKKPLNLKPNPMSPELEIKAVAGPMNMEQAENFRRRWKTPPSLTKCQQNNSLNLSSSSLNSSNPDLLLLRSPIRGRPSTTLRFDSPGKDSLASTPISKAKSSLFSICEFIKEEEKTEKDVQGFSHNFGTNSVKKKLFSNFRSRLESSLNSSCVTEEEDEDQLDGSLNLSYKERHLKLTDSEKGLEVVGRMLAKEQNVGWKEYWNFLDNFTNLSSPSGLFKLEHHLKTRAEVLEKTKENNRLHLSDICEKLNEFHLNNSNNFNEKPIYLENKTSSLGDPNNNAPATSPLPLNAHLCVEKSCQVYAKRVIKAINNNFDNAASLNSALNAELQRLESLVCSYKDDIRFKKINFQCVHSRFAHLILTYLLENDSNYKNLMPKLKKSLQVILNSQIKFSSEEDSFSKMDNKLKDEPIKTTSHLKCLTNFFLNFALNEEQKMRQFRLENLTADNECEEVWQDESKCNCVWNLKYQSNAHNMHLKYPNVRLRDNKKKQKRINHLIKKKIDLSQGTEYSTWECRGQSNKEEDDEIFWSDASDQSVDSVDSDDCIFYTPIASPTEFLTASDNSDLDEDRARTKQQNRPSSFDLATYKNYILGEEPTKTDIDAFTAICDTEISPNQYPNIVKWQKAIRMHSAEEIQNFPRKLRKKPSAIKSIYFKKQISSVNYDEDDFCLIDRLTKIDWFKRKLIVPTESTSNIVLNCSCGKRLSFRERTKVIADPILKLDRKPKLKTIGIQTETDFTIQQLQKELKEKELIIQQQNIKLHDMELLYQIKNYKEYKSIKNGTADDVSSNVLN